MNKKYLPSLIIFAKGFMITALGILFRFMEDPTSNVLLCIGGGLIAVSFIVLFVMYMIKPKVS